MFLNGQNVSEPFTGVRNPAPAEVHVLIQHVSTHRFFADIRYMMLCKDFYNYSKNFLAFSTQLVNIDSHSNRFIKLHYHLIIILCMIYASLFMILVKVYLQSN